MTPTKIQIKKRSSAKTFGRGCPSKYPFEGMEVDNCFEVGDYTRKKSKSIYGCIYHFIKQDGNQGKKFTCRKTKAGKIQIKREA